MQEEPSKMHCTLMLLSLSAAIAVISGLQPCETPKQWEGRVLVDDRDRAYTLYGKLSYDALNMRMRLIEEDRTGEERESYDEIFLYKEQRSYRINLHTRECENMSFVQKFVPFEVHPNSTYYGSAYIGTASAPDAGVEVDLWGGETQGEHYSGSWTTKDCLPVIMNSLSEKIGFRTENFFDITLGLSDPNVFIPPENCHSN